MTIGIDMTGLAWVLVFWVAMSVGIGMVVAGIVIAITRDEGPEHDQEHVERVGQVAISGRPYDYERETA